jgi:hypothetical protein
MAFAEVAMDDGLKFDAPQLTRSQPRRGVGQLSDALRARFVEVALGNVRGVEVEHVQSRISEM